MSDIDENNEERRRADRGYEILVPVAFVALGLLLVCVMVLVAAFAVGILPNN